MSPAPTPRNVLGLLGAFVATSVVAGLLAAGLAMPAVGASGVAARNSVDFFDSLPGDLKTPPLSEQSTLLANDGKTVVATFYEENRVNVDLKNIAPIMQRAIIAIEDSRFYQHGGVDPKGVVRAFVVNLKSGGTEQGASTLTQQYVKNVLVEAAVAKGDKAGVQAAVDKTKARKIQEIRYAVAIEKKLSKDEILNRYLNIAPFGGQIYGVQAAAKYYFGVDAKDLNLVQAATLAGMVQSPTKFSPVKNPKDSRTRRDIVLRRMRQLNIIDQPTLDKALATKLKTKLTPTRSGCANAKPLNAWFCDYVYLYMTKSKDFASLGKTQEERQKTLARGGLRITTTMDPKVAKSAWNAVSKTIRPKDKSRVAAAAVTIQPGTGNVLAISQNRFFNPDEGRGQTAINYSTDIEYGGSGGFQTGSTFKPFTLATWLKEGHSLFQSVSAATGTAPFSAFKSCNYLDRSQSYTYYNSEGKGSGSVSVYEGTYKSINGAYVSMEKQLDLCDIADTAADLGVHLASPQPDICKVTKDPNEKKPLTRKLPNCVPSLTLGVKEIAPMTMANAYATFAASGKYCAPRAVQMIEDRDRRQLAVPGPKCRQGLEEKIADTVNYGLNHVFKPGGTAARVGGLPNGRPASGKTGTSNNSAQTWFAGYTPQVATAVWVGNPFPKAGWTLNHKTINGQYYSSVFGATLAAPIWKKIMTTATDGLPIVQFKKPDTKLVQGDRKSVPDVTGQKVGDAVQILEGAGFKADVNGGVVPSKYPAGTVAATSPGGGSRVEPGTTISISVSGGGGFGGGVGGGRRGNGNGGGNGGGNNDNLLDRIFPPPRR
jgi:membrane peptidoglycan carboxypeptidase